MNTTTVPSPQGATLTLGDSFMARRTWGDWLFALLVVVVVGRAVVVFDGVDEDDPVGPTTGSAPLHAARASMADSAAAVTTVVRLETVIGVPCVVKSVLRRAHTRVRSCSRNLP